MFCNKSEFARSPSNHVGQGLFIAAAYDNNKVFFITESARMILYSSFVWFCITADL